MKTKGIMAAIVWLWIVGCMLLPAWAEASEKSEVRDYEAAKTEPQPIELWKARSYG